MRLSEPAPAKINLALHVRGRMADGRHRLETIFAFCTEGDIVHAESADDISLSVTGPFADGLGEDDNLVLRAASALRRCSASDRGAFLHLEKKLPIASGMGGGSADAAATLRLLTRMWKLDPAHAAAAAPELGADVPACLLSMTAKGDGAGDELTLVDAGVSGLPVLLVNPRVPLSTADVFAQWAGEDDGPLDDWRVSVNGLQEPAKALVPQIGLILAWLSTQRGVTIARMSGSGATCFALFDSEQDRDAAATAVPREWWYLATHLR